jgi:hypothetical protein
MLIVPEARTAILVYDIVWDCDEQQAKLIGDKKLVQFRDSFDIESKEIIDYLAVELAEHLLEDNGFKPIRFFWKFVKHS